MNILAIFGTRPEAIKMVPVIRALHKNFGDNHAKVCVTGQHRGMLDQILELFAIKPDYDLNIMKKNQSLVDITSQILKKLRAVFQIYRPDIVLVHGDTTTTLAASLAAFYEKIMVGHIEAGLRSDNIYSPWPEELNRRITSLISEYHFAPTQLAANNLIKAGVAEKRISITGNTVVDTLLEIHDRLLKDNNLSAQMQREFDFLDSTKKLILVTGHRRENFGQAFQNICHAIASLSTYPGIEIVYPVHMNPNVQEPVNKLLSSYKNIHLIKPLDYLPFVYLMGRSYFILTDSGGIQEEAPSLGKPVLIMRDVTERMEGIVAGTAKLVGTNKDKILAEAIHLLEDQDYYQQMSLTHNPYGDGKASERILNKLIELAGAQQSSMDKLIYVPQIAGLRP